MVKLMKKVILSICLVIAAQVLLHQVVPGLQSTGTVQAASIKLNKTSKTIYEGNTYKLKVKGTNKKVKWSTSDKSIAKVNSKGKVTAKKNGTAVITAKVGKKELKCKVKVRLLQFKNDIFYSLKEASTAYSTKELKTAKTFLVDLDGDGEKDNITIEPHEYIDEYDIETVEYIYKLNDTEFLKADTCEVYLVDLDKKDKTVEFIMPSPYPYDCDRETRYAIYAKNGDTMKFIKHINISRGMRTNKKGTILVDTYLTKERYITPRIYYYYYKFKDNKITYNKTNVKQIKKYKFKLNSNKYSPWYIAPNKKAYKKGQKLLYDYAPYKKFLKYNIKKLRKGVTFKIIKFLDTQGEMYVKLSNGHKGYVLNPYKYDHE